MKKSEILSLSVALAGSIAAMLPQHAAADECGTVTDATGVATCTIASGGYLQESLTFSGSKGVKTVYDNNANYFAACSSHFQGKSSFGMTTQSTQMTVRSATGAAVNAASGCG